MAPNPRDIGQAPASRLRGGQRLQGYRRSVGGVNSPGIVEPRGFKGMAALAARVGRVADVVGDHATRAYAKDVVRRSEKAAEAYVQNTDDLADIRLPAGNSLADEAFRRSAQLAASSRLEMAAVEDVTRLQEQTRGDPEMFRELLQTTARETLSSLDPELRGSAEQLYARLGMRAYQTLADEVRAVEIDKARAEVEGSLATLTTQAAQLAREGDAEGAMALVEMAADKLAAGAPVAAGGSGIFSFTEIDRLTRASREGIQEQLVRGWAERDPSRAWTALQGGRTFQAALMQRESSGKANVVNGQGFAGLYQFGAARLADLGFYRPAPDEDLGANQWAGEFVGIEGVESVEDFLANPEAQQLAFERHLQDIDRRMDGDGLLVRFGGQTVAGVPVTRDAIRAMAHLGGYEGAKRFLESGGATDPADANGTRVSDYGRQFANVEGQTPGILTETGDPIIDAVLDEMHPAQRDRLSASVEAEVVAIQQERARAENARLRDLERQWTNIRPLVERGISTPDLERLETEAEGTPIYAEIVDARRASNRVQAFSRQPLATQAWMLQRNAKNIADGVVPASEVAVNDKHIKSYQRILEAVEKDPLGAYVQQTGTELPPVNWGDPNSIVSDLQARAGIADEAETWLGGRPLPLTKPEADMLGDQLDAYDTGQRGAVLGALIEGLGEEGAMAVLGEVAPKQPALAHIGRLMATGANPQAITDALAGDDLVRSGAAEEIIKGSVAARATENINHLDQAFGPEMALQRSMIADTAARIYAVRALRAGTGHVFDSTIYKQALEDASGGGFERINGQNTIRPVGWEDGALGDLLGNMNGTDWIAGSVSGRPPRDLDGELMPVDQLRDARLEPVGDGVYLVNLNRRNAAPRYVITDEGEPYLLDIHKASEQYMARPK